MSRLNGGRGGVIVNISSMAGDRKDLLSSLNEHLFEEGFNKKKSKIILGCFTLSFCRYWPSATVSCLHGLQARAGWLHPSRGGEDVG